MLIRKYKIVYDTKLVEETSFNEETQQEEVVQKEIQVPKRVMAYYRDDVEITEEEYNRIVPKLRVPTPQELWEQEYPSRVVQYIREKYSLDDELAILRQRDTKPLEFTEYNLYVEECKRKAKQSIPNESSN